MNLKSQKIAKETNVPVFQRLSVVNQEQVCRKFDLETPEIEKLHNLSPKNVELIKSSGSKKRTHKPKKVIPQFKMELNHEKSKTYKINKL